MSPYQRKFRVVISDWKINRQVILLEQIDGDERTVADFYTTATGEEIKAAADTILIGPLTVMLFKDLESKLPPPKIGGPFAHLHPYLQEHGRTAGDK